MTILYSKSAKSRLRELCSLAKLSSLELSCLIFDSTLMLFRRSKSRSWLFILSLLTWVTSLSSCSLTIGQTLVCLVSCRRFLRSLINIWVSSWLTHSWKMLRIFKFFASWIVCRLSRFDYDWLGMWRLKSWSIHETTSIKTWVSSLNLMDRWIWISPERKMLFDVFYKRFLIFKVKYFRLKLTYLTLKLEVFILQLDYLTFLTLN